MLTLQHDALIFISYGSITVLDKLTGDKRPGRSCEEQLGQRSPLSLDGNASALCPWVIASLVVEIIELYLVKGVLVTNTAKLQKFYMVAVQVAANI